MLGVAAATVVGAAMVCFSIGMAHIFYRSKRKRWQTILAWALCSLLIAALGGLLRPVIGNRAGQFTGFLAVFVYLYLFDVPVKQRFFTYFMVDTCMYLTALAARYTVLLVHGFFPVFSPRITFVILYFFLTGAVVFVFFKFLRAPVVERLAQVRVQELTAQTRQAEQYYVSLAGHIQEIRRMQHDSRHHLRVLSGYVRDGAYGQLEAYLSTLTEQSPDVGNFLYCANYTANILLGFYAEQARGEGIEFQCDAQIPADLNCTPVDICAVLGNALQNALDACALQDTGKRRYISLLARMVGHNLTLEFKNSYDGVAVEENGRLLTRKEGPGHGLGLASIQRAAELYHGYCAVSRGPQEFTLRVVLNLEQN